jgi:hypothetical protein
MAETTGLVGFVKVNATQDSNFALFQVLDASTTPPTPELFFIWFAPTDARSGVPTGPQWLHRALQVGLAREALVHAKTVTVFHDDTSPFVNSMQINT